MAKGHCYNSLHYLEFIAIGKHCISTCKVSDCALIAHLNNKKFQQEKTL